MAFDRDGQLIITMITEDKKDLFNKSTKELLRIVDETNMPDYSYVHEIVARIRYGMLSDAARRKVLGTKNAKDLQEYPSNGYCAVASISFMLANPDKDWKLMYIDDLWTFGPHFYLKYAPSETVLDLTFDQYVAYNIKSIPYELGRISSPTGLVIKMAQKFSRAIGLPQKQYIPSTQWIR